MGVINPSVGRASWEEAVCMRDNAELITTHLAALDPSPPFLFNYAVRQKVVAHVNEPDCRVQSLVTPQSPARRPRVAHPPARPIYK